MEEQRARQEAEAAAATRESATEGATPAPAGGGLSEEDAMLQRALSMSMETDEAEVNLEAMTEEEQASYISWLLDKAP
jgi:hypothetical protein